jgi:xylulokinase
VRALAVTSTSGSLVVAGEGGVPLRPAILYDDARATGRPTADASWSLAKAAWVRDHEPAVWAAARHLLHPADWLTGKLTGNWRLSDYSNSLKLGYDPVARRWGSTELPAALLPEVLTPGVPAGRLSAGAARATGVPAGTTVAAGATDGIAGLLASGASRPGDGSTTLGTTLVWKLLASERPEAAGVYSHLHPCGLWAPGAASNSGPGCLAGAAALDEAAAAYLPTALFTYPLGGAGERFPFRDAGARSFQTGEACCAAELHAAQLQALAFIERWGYERISPTLPGRVFSTGGAAASRVLSRLRAQVLGRPVLRAACASSAFGAAILAASEDYCGVPAAIEAMVHPDTAIDPDSGTSSYQELYLEFRAACAARGMR